MTFEQQQAIKQKQQAMFELRKRIWEEEEEEIKEKAMNEYSVFDLPANALIGLTIVKIDLNSIYLSDGSTIDFHAYETYFNVKEQSK